MVQNSFSFPPLHFITTEQIECLLRTIIDFFETPIPEDEYTKLGDIGHEWIRHQQGVAIAATRFVSMAANVQQAHEVLPLLTKAIALAAPFDDGYRFCDQKELFIQNLAMFLWSPETDLRSIASFVEHREFDFRYWVASHLPLRDGLAQQYLEILSKDPDGMVRNRAQKKLAKAMEIPWWWGVFQEDPIPRVPPERQQEVIPLFAPLKEMLSLTYKKFERRKDEFAEMMDTLPPELSAEVVKVFFRVDIHWRFYPWMSKWWLATPSGAREFYDEATRRANAEDSFVIWFQSGKLAEVLQAFPKETNLSICQEWIQYLRPYEAGFDDYGSILTRLAEAVGIAWPSDAPLQPLVDFLLKHPKPQVEQILGSSSIAYVLKVFERDDVDLSRIEEALSQARSQDYPGGWQHLASISERYFEAKTNS
ncbi:MAG TPA: hypothetical protein DCE42_03760 [Myxococcales bacterium]|nr:hypothetical protein [Deltaproteobacteria bacterium]HAA53841.1 hypothetical protein [Myxococcales bacterium]|tara:strand:+ start:9703 stop:10968 length:1266 start_codon:yes stop_codon:yes gene_type:complete